MTNNLSIPASSHLSKGETVPSTHTSAEVCQTGAFHLWKGETRQGLIVICVPTCMRPQMLGECLRSIANSRMPPDFETRLTVIDNDAKESAREMFSSLRFPFAARYIVEPRRGLCAVRNRALDETQKENADYLAFCDDDQIVDKNWLCALVDGMNETGADAIGGYVVDVYADGKTPWWVRDSKITPDESAKITKAGFPTNLLLMKARVFAELRFDDDFNLTGAEDYDFSRRAMLKGFVSATTGKAKATAEAHPSRLTLRNHFMTQWQRQTGYVLSHRKTGGALAAARFLPKGIVKLAKGALCGALGVFLGKKMMRRALKNIIAGSGMCYGVFAAGNFQKYANIDGR